MSTPDSPNKRPSLADYLVRYDLKGMIDEAKLDYVQSSSGTPRLLNQKDIAARFRKPAPPAAKPATP
jgi:hypothetical protein